MRRDRKANGRRSIIVRRDEIVERPHHGGAWKVAYADFVTAMMAFFLLMWLLNATTEEQRRGIANYFSPIAQTTPSQSGSGAPFGGRTPFDPGAMVSESGALQVVEGAMQPVQNPPDQDADAPALHPAPQNDGPAPPSTAGARNQMSGNEVSASAVPAEATPVQQGRDPQPNPSQPAPGAQPRASVQSDLSAQTAEAEQHAFDRAANQIRALMQHDPGMVELSRQLAIDTTPEGLRIQVMDEDQRPMFDTGSAVPSDRVRLLLQKIAPVLQQLPEQISIAGHTDATPYHGNGRTNWELSADRANATRRLLVEAGLPVQRIRSVTGNADRDPLLPADPYAAANRRIAIVVLRSAPPGSRNHSPAAPAR